MPSLPTPLSGQSGATGNMPFLSNQPSSPQLERPQVSPAGIVRRLPTPDPAGVHPVPIRSSSRPDGQEGSIPAYGNTLNFGADDSVSDIDPRELGMRRKSSVAVWLMAVLLAAAALGGIAFFAVKRDPNSNGGNGAGPDHGIPATPLPSATPLPTPSAAVTPGTITIGDPVTTPAVTKDAAAATPTPPVTTPTPAARPANFPWRPAPGGAGHAPRTPARPATPATTNDPPPPDPRPTPPGLAPDPFGTPE